MATTSGKGVLTGFREMEALLKELPAVLAADAMRAAVTAALKPIRDAARDNAPVGSKSHKDRYGNVLLPGTLRRSIRVWIVRQKGAVTTTGLVGIPKRGVAAQAWYGRLREFEYPGVYGPAKPWLRPAFDQNYTKAIAVLGQALSKQILKQARRLSGKYGTVRKKLIK